MEVSRDTTIKKWNLSLLVMVQAVVLVAVQAVAAMLVVVAAAVVAVVGVVLLMVVLVQLLSHHLHHIVVDVANLGRLAGRALCMLRPAALLRRYVAGCGGSFTQMVLSQATALSVNTMRVVFVIVALARSSIRRQ